MAIDTSPRAPRQTVVADQEQRAFRALLDAMSRPGTIHELPEARATDGVWGSALVVMQCLLDHEVTFAVEVIEMTSEGYLEEPERSATVVVRVDAIGSGSLRAVLSGPGIETVQSLAIEGLDASALHALIERNALYPTGIDIVLVDPQGRVACLPRSTRIEVED